MLTFKQKKLLDFLINYFNKNNVYPTFDEMRDFLQIKSKSGIHKLLSSLEEKGFVNRLPHKARALSINLNANVNENEKNLQPSSFVSFKKWKRPMSFTIDSPSHRRDVKRMSLIEFWKIAKKDQLSDPEFVRASSHFNKYTSIGCSPVSLFPLLLFTAIRRGRRETYANLFFGVLICLLFFILGTSLGESLGQNGYGWWLSNIIAGILGIFMIKVKK